MTVYFSGAADYGLDEWSSRGGFSQQMPPWQGNNVALAHEIMRQQGVWNNWHVKADPWQLDVKIDIWDSKTDQGPYDEFSNQEWTGWRQGSQMPEPAPRTSDWTNASAQVFASLPEEPREVLVVNSNSSGAYDSLCRDAAKADVVAFDCEWVPDWEYGSDNPISVMQLAFPSSFRCYVLQLGPLNRRLPQDVQMMLVNPEVAKVGFAVNQKDAEKLTRSGIAVTQGSVVDVQEQCSAALGLSWERSTSLSLKRAAQELLGCALLKDKRCACSDWSSPTLTPEQVRYAALDAWVALRLYYLPQ